MEIRTNHWYVYILKCSDDTLYTGITTDPDRRINEHNSGTGAKYTRSRLPVQMIHCEVVCDRSSALKREAQIKSMSRIEKLKLIK